MNSGSSPRGERGFLENFLARGRATAVADADTTKLLISRVQAGDRDALETLCSRYLMRVLAAVRARLGAKLRQKVESWDVVQDVLIDAVRRVNSFEFRTEGAFLKFLNKIVENRIRDEADRWAAKKRDANLEVPLKPSSPDGADPYSTITLKQGWGSPSGILSLSEDLSRLEAAMDNLTEEYRELIVATKLEGRTYAEIAEESEISTDAVRMRLSRAMAALTREFRKLDGGGG